MASSLGRRLTFAFAVVGLGSALLTAVLVNVAFGDQFDSYLDQQRAGRERQLATAFTSAYDTPEGFDLGRLDQLGPAVAMTGAEIRLVDGTGALVWSLTDSQMGPDMARMHREMTSSGRLLPEASVPLTVGGKSVGTLFLRLPEGTVPLADQEFRRSVNALLAVGGLGAGMVAVGLGVVFARRMIRPLTELTVAARELQAGHRTRRAVVGGSDEIAQLARAFNDLVESVEREDVIRRSFAADVAHELRTPLAILRSHLEAVQDGVTEPTPTVVSSLHDETLRLGRQVADLETMTSADGVAFTLRPQVLDLSEVVTPVASDLEHRFQEQHLQLILDLQPAAVSGDETRLRQVVTNLLTNALKFVPPGGTVTVSTGITQDWAVLEVRDDGPGIPPDEIGRVFDRFYRGSQFRTGGSGIGLAVVATLVRAHGGDVTATSIVERGTRFNVRIPKVDHGGANLR